MRGRLFAVLVGVGVVTLSASVYLRAVSPPQAPSSERALLDNYCVTCHNERRRPAG